MNKNLKVVFIVMFAAILCGLLISVAISLLKMVTLYNAYPDHGDVFQMAFKNCIFNIIENISLWGVVILPLPILVYKLCNIKENESLSSVMIQISISIPSYLVIMYLRRRYLQYFHYEVTNLNTGYIISIVILAVSIVFTIINCVNIFKSIKNNHAKVEMSEDNIAI